MIKVTDDWLPCFPGNQVQVSIHKDGKGSWRIAVWGEDDFGMEKSDLSQDEAFTEFRNLQDGISQSELKNRGFVRA